MSGIGFFALIVCLTYFESNDDAISSPKLLDSDRTDYSSVSISDSFSAAPSNSRLKPTS